LKLSTLAEAGMFEFVNSGYGELIEKGSVGYVGGTTYKFVDLQTDLIVFSANDQVLGGYLETFETGSGKVISTTTLRSGRSFGGGGFGGGGAGGIFGSPEGRMPHARQSSASTNPRYSDNPVIQHMRANNAKIRKNVVPFMKHMIRSSIDGAGYAGAGITAVGTVVTPFVPHVGVGLLGVGGSVSTASGAASSFMNFLEGNYLDGLIDASLVGLGSAGSWGLKVLKNRQIINSTDEVVLKSVYNSSMDILGIGVIPAVKK
jgi:hypothetical protein